MSLSSGTRLGPYEIVALLGAGGMGEVYKARDTRLDRTVAVKVLPADRADDPQFRERFEREARAVAALNHPNICALYDVGREGDVHFLVMELLEGDTLSERLGRGTLPLDQTLRHAVEIAGALHAAHRAGIVHRDLKPANIMLTKTGAKLLDFGLAKAGGGGPATSLSMMPTTPAGITVQGQILGTFQYMAPEQLDGEEADARTDIFAFGAVLFEMLTGRKAFAGKSQATLIAAIVGSEPPSVSSLVPVAPAALDRIVRTCLAKERDERWQSAGDLTRELKWLVDAGAQSVMTTTSVPAHALPSTTSAPTPALRSARGAWAVAAMAVALLASGAIAVRSGYVSLAPDDGTSYVTSIVTEGLTIPPGADHFALSPDGTRLVFVVTQDRAGPGARRLYVRRLDSTSAQELTGTDGAAAPFWSPDSRFVAFHAQGKLKKVDVGGGPPVILCDGTISLPGTWNRDDVIVFPQSGIAGLHRVSATGGETMPVTTVDQQAGDVGHGAPHFLPDGEHFLHSAGQLTQTRGVFVASLDQQETPTFLIPGGANPRYALGHLFFERGGSLWAQPFNPSSRTLSGEPVEVAQGVAIGGATGRAAAYSVSDSGQLVYRLGEGQRSISTQLAWFDRAGASRGLVGEPGEYGNLQLSPDGTRALVSLPTSSSTLGRRNLWIVDLGRGLRNRFTFSETGETAGIWSPDGSRVAFAGRLNPARGQTDIVVKASSGSGGEEPLLATPQSEVPRAWSPDGRFIIYATAAEGRTDSDLWVLPLTGDRKPFPFLATPFNEDQAQFSPDGRWVAYASNEGGPLQVYVMPFVEPGREGAMPAGKWQVSTMRGTAPVWRADGREIVYTISAQGNGPRTFAVAAVDGTGPDFRVGAVQTLFTTAISNLGRYFDITPDGQRLLVNTLLDQSPSAPPPMTLVVNWPAMLRK